MLALGVLGSDWERLGLAGVAALVALGLDWAGLGVAGECWPWECWARSAGPKGEAHRPTVGGGWPGSAGLEVLGLECWARMLRYGICVFVLVWK